MQQYRYLNLNPFDVEENDCVCRAISLATQLHYSVIERLLKRTAEKFRCDELCPCCYHYLLENKFGFRCYNGKGKTVKEVAYYNKDSICVIRIDGHLTCSFYGVLYDTWDCLDEICDCYWIR